ncbi:MAG: zonular occludens toxin domain-containing protein, partial [Gallionellaceae bacterium]|nr:zonular occludens toxin domain-containing protein [Gallionellaceae bacterium]
MITIISGTPGSGKTALIVDMMMEELKKGRKIFTIGIPKLLLNVYEGGDSHTWQDGTWLQIDRYDPAMTKAKGIKSTWMPRGCPDSCEFLSTCPRLGQEKPDAGSLIIIDESHTDFPQRASGKTPPPYVEALTVHR